MVIQEQDITQTQEISLGKGILITLAIIVLIALFIGSATLLHLKHLWIPFLGLAVWSCMGMNNEMKEMAKVWIGGAVAAFISLLIAWLPTKYGMVSLAIPMGIIVIFILSTVINKLDLIFNMSTAIFLTVFTAIPAEASVQATYYLDLSYGALIFWILPQMIMKVVAHRSVKENRIG